ncbi:MAG TPA: beta-N-acetylhexosaminidase [Candidatus Hydrogenedentes bacterium]|nr:beta-N-acetylhexosaminidase [Candidatus Hydrogenedentota bacterium]
MMMLSMALLNAVAFAALPEPMVVPKPVKLERREGVFTLEDATRVTFPAGDAAAEAAAGMLGEALRPATGLPLAAGPGVEGANTLHLRTEETGLGPEGYRLEVAGDRALITGAAGPGLFYGVQTLRQLLPAAVFGAARAEGTVWAVPCVRVEDRPRFAWRGMLLDPARHFMPLEFVKKFVDTLALHKMNRLHLHLTDDQGWRIEIKKYPKLTEVGAWRAETLVGHYAKKPWTFDGTRHGGFYTQDEIRDLVAYAAARHVTIMPEIEMPGHAQAAIAAYPQLGNVAEPLQVLTYWGVNPNIFNPEESTILFLQDVLAEVADIFPGTYIHIGGDEAVKEQWEKSPAVQKRMADLGLKDEDRMQSYFISRMNDFLKARGKRLVGWDEIMDGGLGTDATVMAWRSVDKGITAAKAGHDVVMAPTAFTYFDYYQAPAKGEPLGIGGFLPLKKAYSFDPVPGELDAAAAARVLGAQAQLWSEYILTPEHCEHMAFPRACALAEIVWTPQADRDYEDFTARLAEHLKRLKNAGVNFRPLDK